MSLYAFNQSLYGEVGDWVNTGDTIATLGNSGGREKAALYFEIRKKNKPLNPEKWCKKQALMYPDLFGLAGCKAKKVNNNYVL